MKKYNKSVNAQSRRRTIITKLEEQLKSGVKPIRGYDGDQSTLPLSKEDVSRIKSELEILKERV